MKRIVLFSPTGYIGGFIKERLQEEKDVQLYEITRNDDLERYEGRYDLMIYSASVSRATAEKYVQDNVMAAITIMNFCKKHSVQRVIYLSSDSIYGEINTDVVNEKAIMVNPDIYGTTKYLAEKIIMGSGIPYYILRMPGVVGRIYRKGVFIQALMDKIRNSDDLELYNINRKFNNILHVDDLIDFIVVLCSGVNKSESEIFCLGNTEKIELEKLINYLKEKDHSTSRVSSIDTDQKRYFTLDVSKAAGYGYTSKPIKAILDECYQIQ